MTKVTPTALLSGLPCASFNVPANLIRRGTAKVGTTSLGACAVWLGDSGAAVTSPRPCLDASSSDTGRCCACAPATPRKNTKHNRDHLAVRFMEPLLSSEAEEFQVFSWVRATALCLPKGDNPKKAGRWPTRLGGTLNFQIAIVKKKTLAS